MRFYIWDGMSINEEALFWNINDSIGKLTFSSTCGVSLWELVIKICQIMATITNTKKFRKYKGKFFFTVE